MEKRAVIDPSWTPPESQDPTSTLPTTDKSSSQQKNIPGQKSASTSTKNNSNDKPQKT